MMRIQIGQKSNRTVKNLGLAALYLLFAVFSACVFCVATSVRAEERGKQTIACFSYDDADFTVTEDYSAYVDSAKFVFGEGTANNGSVMETMLYNTERKQKVQLDQGKSGLLFTTKKTGDAADGATFSLSNPQYGNFDMDFRVFSEYTYEGLNWSVPSTGDIDAAGHDGLVSGAEITQGNAFNPNWMPFADLRTLGIKFTSVSDHNKYFTVYIEHSMPWRAARPMARVYINGDAYSKNGRRGYGIGDNVLGSTPLNGTSFMNVNGTAQDDDSWGLYDPETFSNAVRFDLDTMTVSAKTAGLKYTRNSESKLNGAMHYVENYVPVRILNDAASGCTLQRSDFAAGYTVDVIMDDITADNTPLYATTKGEGKTKSEIETEGGTWVYDTENVSKLRAVDFDNNGKADTPTHTGKLIVYSVNGMDMRVNKGFTKESASINTNAEAYWKDSTPYGGRGTYNGYRLTATEQNEHAEGNGITLKAEEFTTIGENKPFKVLLAAIPKSYAVDHGENTALYGNNNNFTYIDNNNKDADAVGGIGANMNEFDPYSDVREYSLTFRSTQNPSAAFTVYIASSNTGFWNSWKSPDTVSMRVGVEGETFRNDSGQKGFGYGGNGNKYENKFYTNLQSTLAGGTMGGKVNLTNGSTWGKKTNPYTSLKVDFSTMKVYTWGEKTERLVRDLTKTDDVPCDAEKSGVSGALCKALSPADFANNGYTVTLKIERMNRRENRGLKTMNTLKTASATRGTLTLNYPAEPNAESGYILAKECDRQCVIDIFAYKDETPNDGMSLTENAIGGISAPTKYDAANTFCGLDLGVTSFVMPTGGFTFMPQIKNLAGMGSAVTQLAYAHASDTTDKGTIEENSAGVGTYLFLPKNLGVYTITATCDNKTYTVPINVTVASVELRLKSGLPVSVALGEALSFTAADTTVEAELAENVTVTCTLNGEAVDLTSAPAAQKGVYRITYTLRGALNSKSSVERVVFCFDADTSAPIIGWNAPLYLVKGGTLDTSGVKAEDDYSAVSVTVTATLNGNALSLTDGVIAVAEAGELTVTVTATDAAGNIATRTYRIFVFENEPQVITAA